MTPPGAPPTPPTPIPPLVAPKGGGKKVFVALLSFLVAIALGAVGYFFVYPLLSENAPAPEAEVSPSPSLPAPEPPPAEPQAPPQETPPPVTETPSEDPFSGISGIPAHRSLFRTAADTTTEVILTAPTLEALKRALPSGAVAAPVFTEVVMKMPSGNVFPFSAVAKLLAPTFFTDTRLASFDDDATYFTYAAPNGTWFGIAVSLKPGVPIGPIQDTMAEFQRDPDLANFFLENPGERGVWKDGLVRGKPTSQVSFATPGATFSYTWFERTLLISTNLTAAEQAASRLGF